MLHEDSHQIHKGANLLSEETVIVHCMCSYSTLNSVHVYICTYTIFESNILQHIDQAKYNVGLHVL